MGTTRRAAGNWLSARYNSELCQQFMKQLYFVGQNADWITWADNFDPMLEALTATIAEVSPPTNVNGNTDNTTLFNALKANCQSYGVPNASSFLNDPWFADQWTVGDETAYHLFMFSYDAIGHSINSIVNDIYTTCMQPAGLGNETAHKEQSGDGYKINSYQQTWAVAYCASNDTYLVICRLAQIYSYEAIDYTGMVGSLAVGTVISVQIQGGSITRNYTLVHNGNPDPTVYDSSCNVAFFLIDTDVGGNQYYDRSQKNYYPDSDLADWMESTAYQGINATFRQYIPTVKIPYHAGSSSYGDNTYHILSDGFSCHVFAPSNYELGVTTEYVSQSFNEGATFDYFVGTAASDPKRIYGEQRYWTRTPYMANGSDAFTINATEGRAIARNCGQTPYRYRYVMPVIRTTPLSAITVVSTP